MGSDRCRRDRPDGNDHRWHRTDTQKVDGAFNSRRRRECHRVSGTGGDNGPGIGIAGNCAVGDDLIHLPALGLEPGHQNSPHRLGPGKEDPGTGTTGTTGTGTTGTGATGATGTGATGSGKCLGQCIADRHLRYQGRRESPLGQPARRGRPHRRPPRAVGDRPPTEGGQKPRHRVGRGECHPGIGPADHPIRGLGQSGPAVDWILNGDDRQLDHRRPQRREVVHQRRGLCPGAGHHHTSAGQRPRRRHG